MTFYIIITGMYPCKDALDSAKEQIVPADVVVFCNCDCSPVKLNKVIGKNVFIHETPEQDGSAKNKWGLGNAVNMIAKPDDVLVFLDGDDRLVGRNALAPVYNAYAKNPGLLLTYGSYRYKSNGKKGTFCGEYRSRRPFRRSPWHGTHLKTCKVKLWKHLPESVFKDKDGNWLMVTSDVAMMLPLLEMAGHDRIKYIPQVIYEYNDENQFNDHKLRGKLQIETDKWIRSLPAFQRENVV